MVGFIKLFIIIFQMIRLHVSEQTIQTRSLDNGSGDNLSDHIAVEDLRDNLVPRRHDVPNSSLIESTESDLETPVHQPGPVASYCESSLTKLAKVCGQPYWSCRGRCGEGPVKGVQEILGTCYCDTNCYVYSTCCDDFHAECRSFNAQAEDIFKALGRGLSVCQYSYKVISHCQYGEGWTSKAYDICSGIDVSSFEHLLPVVDSATGLHFRNKACWECNNGPSLHLGQPLSGSIISFLPPAFVETLWYDIDFLIDQLRKVTDISIGQPPSSHVPYQCQSDVYPCWNCPNTVDVHRGMICRTPSSRLSNHHPSCYLCSGLDSHEIYGVDVTSDMCPPQLIKPAAVDLTDSHNVFSVMIKALGNGDFSIRNLAKEKDKTYSWETLVCNIEKSSCEAVSCLHGLSVENGKCDSDESLVSALVYLCAGVTSEEEAAAAMERDSSACDPEWPGISDAQREGLLMDTMRNDIEHCLRESKSPIMTLEKIEILKDIASLGFLLRFAWDRSGEMTSFHAELLLHVCCASCANLFRRESRRLEQEQQRGTKHANLTPNGIRRGDLLDKNKSVSVINASELCGDGETGCVDEEYNNDFVYLCLAVRFGYVLDLRKVQIYGEHCFQTNYYEAIHENGNGSEGISWYRFRDVFVTIFTEMSLYMLL